MKAKISRMKSASHMFIVLFALGSMVIGLGQACSSSLGVDASSAVATTESSSISAGSNSSLALTPSLQTIAYNSTLTLVASGGTAPYSFFLASGTGAINSTTGVYTAGPANATVSIGVSDAKNTKVYAVIMVASTTGNITLAGAYSKVISTSYSNLVNYNGACTQAAPYGDGCNLAIHQYCQNLKYGTGFGPIEHSGDLAIITCMMVGTTTMKTVAYVGYAGIQSSCKAGVALSDGCLSAQNRYCKALGMVSGFGPITHDAANGTVECISSTASVLMDVDLATIEAQVPSCTETNASSPDCLSAASRYCKTQGFVSGYGLLEHNTTTVEIFCTR